MTVKPKVRVVINRIKDWRDNVSVVVRAKCLKDDGSWSNWQDVSIRDTDTKSLWSFEPDVLVAAVCEVMNTTVDVVSVEMVEWETVMCVDDDRRREGYLEETHDPDPGTVIIFDNCTFNITGGD